MKRLFIVRHATTSWNTEGRLNSHTDLGLSEIGQEECSELVRLLAGIEISSLVVSPLKRAVETASRIAEVLKVPYSIDDRLVELDFGPFEGMTPQQLHGSALGEAFRDWRDEDNPAVPEGVESFDGAAVRARSFFADFVGSNGTTLAVTHGVFGRIMLAECVLSLPGRKYRRLRLDNAALTEVRFEQGLPRLVALNQRRRNE